MEEVRRMEARMETRIGGRTNGDEVAEEEWRERWRRRIGGVEEDGSKREKDDWRKRAAEMRWQKRSGES